MMAKKQAAVWITALAATMAINNAIINTIPKHILKSPFMVNWFSHYSRCDFRADKNKSPCEGLLPLDLFLLSKSNPIECLTGDDFESLMVQHDNRRDEAKDACDQRGVP